MVTTVIARHWQLREMFYVYEALLFSASLSLSFTHHTHTSSERLSHPSRVTQPAQHTRCQQLPTSTASFLDICLISTCPLENEITWIWGTSQFVVHFFAWFTVFISILIAQRSLSREDLGNPHKCLHHGPHHSNIPLEAREMYCS